MPFYVYYSMFGFQRIGDLAWAAGDMQARGFLLGGTSGRTTLNGEGLQHEDGHSHILAGTIPNCVSYDPTFAHEVGVILHHGLKRMVERQENVFYYLTLLNENYAMPGLTAGTEEQIIKGMYLCKKGADGRNARPAAGLGHHPARIDRGPGAAGRRLGRAGQRLELPELQRTGAVTARTPSAATCCTRSRRRGAVRDATAGGPRRSGGRLDRLHEELRRADPPLHPAGPQLTRCWAPTVSAAATSAASCASTSRSTVTSSSWPRCKSLADEGKLPLAKVAEAIAKYGINADKVNPLYA